MLRISWIKKYQLGGAQWTGKATTVFGNMKERMRRYLMLGAKYEILRLKITEERFAGSPRSRGWETYAAGSTVY